MSNHLEDTWSRTLLLLKNEVSDICFSTYFRNIVPASISETTFDLSISDDFKRNIIKNNYAELIQNALAVVTKKNYTVNCFLESELKAEQSSDISPDNHGSNDTKNTTLLNAKYTFETFVTGNGNMLAQAASVAVAESISKAYNPLFLYGGAGLGKTHLMHAIGNYILSRNRTVKVMYVPSEKFTNEWINAIKDKKTVEFQSRYRSVDLLLLDDVPFISGKVGTQEEFFHTFNELYNAGKQIVLSSDKKPSEIPQLEERLRTRFECGLTAGILPPDLETRIAILRKKAQMQQINVPNDVISYIAEHIPSNVRTLEGALNKIIAYSSITGRDLSVILAEEALKDIISKGENREITSTLIINAVCKQYNLRDDDFITSKKRNHEIVYPRQIAMFLCRELTGMSLPSIGLLFGGRDHTTVMHSIKKINEEILTSSKTKQEIEDLTLDIKGPS